MDQNDPSRHVPLSHPLRAGTRGPTTLRCAGCGASHTLQVAVDFAGAVRGAGWSWKLEAGHETYHCSKCT
jgi:hypothetical protein